MQAAYIETARQTAEVFSDQLGRRAVYKLRGCNFMDRRRRVVVACRIECLSSSPVVDNVAVARLLTVHHLQRDSCF